MCKMRSSFSYPHSARTVIYIIYFVNFFSNLTNVEGFDSLLRLPPKYVNYRNTIRSNRVLSVSDYGAKGDGLTDDTKAFQDVWDIACSSPSQLKIVVPAKKSYLIKPVDFVGPCQSNMTLRISGTIVAPKDPHVWDRLDPHKWLFFHNVSHLTVEGGGVVNGMGREWWAGSCKIKRTNPCRHAPTAMTFHRCNYLKVKKLTMLNSQQMHMAFTHCVRVVASKLRVIAPAVSPNTDGIHISASIHVEIKDSIIRTGDDCISIVSNSSVIRIKNIACGPGHGISIGSLGKWNSWDQVHNVRVKGAILSNTENGVRIKTWQGGSGFVRKITFQDIWMENVSNPIIIDQYYCDSLFPCSNQTLAVSVDNISFIGIKGTSATEEAIRFACSDNCPCKGLYLEDIQLVSYSGGITTSFCWKTKGSSSGLIYPPPCFSCGERFIEQRVLSSSVLQSI